MGIVSWIVLGLIAGALAKFLMPGDDPGGCIITILIGIAGSIIGGFLASALGLGTYAKFSLPGLVIAVAGAMLLLLAYRFVKSR